MYDDLIKKMGDTYLKLCRDAQDDSRPIVDFFINMGDSCRTESLVTKSIWEQRQAELDKLYNQKRQALATIDRACGSR